jgi:hypothetical protein
MVFNKSVALKNNSPLLFWINFLIPTSKENLEFILPCGIISGGK